MNLQTLEKVNEFIDEFRKTFIELDSNLYVSYVYHEKEALYEIWYNTQKIEENEKFEENVGELIEKYL